MNTKKEEPYLQKINKRYMCEINLDPKELVDYCLIPDLMEKCIFMQVYEEWLTFTYWVRGFQPNNILEIGTMGSTFWTLSKLSTGKKASVDIEPRQSIIHHFMYGEDWKFFQGDSHEQGIFESIKDFCPKYDLIFIDGDHTYEGVKKDFEMYKSLLSERGYIAFHDIVPDHIFADSYAGQVYKFWQDLDEGSKINIVCKKSSGKIKLNGIYNKGFGGIGLWRP
jgi:predicted O-methyltransferase YrrM